MSGFLKDFKDFVAKGNVLDMAVGVIIGGAFSAIVGSLVKDILTPILSAITGSVKFEDIKVTLGSWENAPTLNVGSFIDAVINFLMIALVIFIIIRQVQRISNRFKKEEAEDTSMKTCPYCLSTIPAEATRCPHCTSALEGYVNQLEVK